MIGEGQFQRESAALRDTGGDLEVQGELVAHVQPAQVAKEATNQDIVLLIEIHQLIEWIVFDEGRDTGVDVHARQFMDDREACHQKQS